MEEKVLFEGKFSRNLITKRCGISGIIGYVVCMIFVSIFADNDPLRVLFQIVGVCSMISVVVAIIALILYGFGNYKMVVTDKRVSGIIKFGKRVDLPLDSVSAIGLSIFQSIAVTTASGAIKFVFMENCEEAYNIISKLIRDRQSTAKNSVQENNVTNTSNADELKKYKDLLDSGVISQEEFDAKKKQLLGL